MKHFSISVKELRSRMIVRNCDINSHNSGVYYNILQVNRGMSIGVGQNIDFRK